jgi:hypothetical protein
LVLASSISAVAHAQDEPAGARGKGTLELRLQTASAVAAGGVFGTVAPPGIAYTTDSEILAVNLLGGAGYFLSPSLALGGDLGLTLIDVGSEELTLVTLAPFAKFVTGFAEREAGFFVEASPGVILASGDGDGAFLQLAVWLGGHFPVGPSAAFLVGPYVTRIDDFDDFGGGEFIVGIRLGMSLYL